MEEKKCPHCGAILVTEKPENNLTEWICKECGFSKKISLLDEDVDDSAGVIIGKIAHSVSLKLNSKIDDKTFDEYSRILEGKLNKLYPVEKLVISALYGLDDGVSKRLEEVSEVLKMDIKTVKQIEKNALRRLYKN
ncbi:MAG: hypothetical protein IKJ19_03370 [Clostridia bacterium]|nr:hypothetical protein [Clostridia bacterium]